MKKTGFIAGVCVGLMVAASVVPLIGFEAHQDVEGFKQRAAMQEMKSSAAWQNMQSQLDQYDAHYTVATNKIALVTDPATKLALTKSLAVTDDLHDALVKLIKCFQDYVKAQGN